MSADKIDDDIRDPENINYFLQSKFQSVLAETDAHSLGFIWKGVFYTYKYSRDILYITLSTLLGIPMAIGWGLLYGVFSFLVVYIITPAYQYSKVVMQLGRSFHLTFIHTFIAPLYDAAGLLFSRVNITFKNTTNEQSDSQAPITKQVYPQLLPADQKSKFEV